jgi:signal peptidase I
MSYGIKMPFGDSWIWMFNRPQRGDVVVFRYPENRDVFFVKRLIGLPGDHLQIQNGQITVNGEPWTLQLSIDHHDENKDKSFTYFYEKIPTDQRAFTEKTEGHEIRLLASGVHIDPDMRDLIVPKHSYFMMGDNRDQSSDSRFWGFVDEKLIIGRAVAIWLSCSDTLESTPMMCDPAKLRPDRIFKGVQRP